MAVHLRDSVSELDVNPLAVLPRGQGVKALDALARPGRVTGPGSRRQETPDSPQVNVGIP